MTARIRKFLTVGTLAVCLAFLIGCGTKQATRSELGTTLGDRQVTAALDGNGHISGQGDSATISFAGGKIVVEKGAVQLNGEELAKLPEGAKQVAVDYTAGKLTITADGSPVVSKELRK